MVNGVTLLKPITKESFRMILNMEKVNRFLRMEISTKVNIIRAKK